LEKLKSTGKFTWDVELISASTEWKVEPHYFVKQGDECFSNRTAQSSANSATCMGRDQQGTVGGFAELKRTVGKRRDELVVFSCDHLYTPTQKMYVNFGQYRQYVGDCTKNFIPRDLSLVTINSKLYDNFDKKFRNSEDEEASARIYDCDVDDLAGEMVHKKGAKSHWTSGTVKYVRHVNDHASNASYSVLLIQGTDKPFSTPGDSAAYVIRNGDDVDISTIDIIGVLSGKWIPPSREKTVTLYGSKMPPKTESLLYEREKKEEELDLILCEDLKSLIEQENFDVLLH
jgi:hypothetical protein